MQSALHQDLVATQVERLLDFCVKHLRGQHVHFRMIGRTVEGTKITDRRAGVAVVDVPVDVVGPKGFRMQPSGDRVGRSSQGREVMAFEQRQTFIGGKSVTAGGFFEQFVCVHGRWQVGGLSRVLIAMEQ